MAVAGEVCKGALFRTMGYVVATKSLGYTSKPGNPGSWGGRRGRGYKPKVMGEPGEGILMEAHETSKSKESTIGSHGKRTDHAVYLAYTALNHCLSAAAA